MRRILRRIQGEADSGTALVAAIGVAVVGIALSVLVVTQTIYIINDTARDRVRTAGVHAAEAALDSAVATLATASPCPGPPPLTVGEGTTSSTVEVVISYFDSDGDPLACNSGSVAGTPARAVITSTAFPVHDQRGINPQRVFEAEVVLVPQVTWSPGAAVFASNSISVGGGFTVAGEGASVWLDNGNFHCSTSTVIEGDLIVANGNMEFNASCRVGGSAWASGNYLNNSPPNFPFQIGGDGGGNLTVLGNISLNNLTRVNGEIRAGGQIRVGSNPVGQGHWEVPWTNTVRSGACATNLTTCPSLDNFTPQGLPEVDYVPSDWTGFTFATPADFAYRRLVAWGLHTLPPNDWQVTTVTGQPCAIGGWQNTTPIPFPSTPTVYDMRSCQLNTNGSVTFRIFADTAFFVQSLQVSNGLRIESGDGQEHQVWIIVPEGGTHNNGVSESTCRSGNWHGITNFCPGNINFDMGAHVSAPLAVFMYTPGSLNYPNSSTTYGQMYARSVTVGQSGGTFHFVGTGVPGVNLTEQSSSADGFRVSIASKREVRND